jgi:hypothetical protein
MTPNFENYISPHACLKRATQLLDQGPDAPLHQIALELRLCLELAIYAKVKVAANHVPASALSSWQPAHALKVLVQLDSSADKDFVLSVGKEITPGVATGEYATIGEHRTYRLDWLRKQYSKLGSYLHAPMPGSSPLDRIACHKYLQETAGVIDDKQKGGINGFWMSGQISSIECMYCSQKVVASQKFVELHGFAECPNPLCSAQYRVTIVDGDSRFESMSVSADCKTCGAKNHLHKRHFNSERFSCTGCKAEHIVRPSRWEYGLAKKPTA